MIRDQLAAIARPYARALMAVPGSDRAALLASLEAADVARLALAGAERIVEREIDRRLHDRLLEEVAGQL